MKQLIPLFVTLIPFSVLAEEITWTFQDSQLQARQEDSVLRVKKMRIVQPSTPFSAKRLPRTLTLPLPDGSTVEFHLYANDLLPEKLAKKYPSIKTYSGYSNDDKLSNGRFELTPNGFHGQFSLHGKLYYIDPLAQDNLYALYDNAHVKSHTFHDEVIYPSNHDSNPLSPRATIITGNNIRRLTLAVSATGEYTNYHYDRRLPNTTENKVEIALGAIATLINRINQFYLTDAGIEFQLSKDNDEVIFTNPATDPFQNNQEDAEKNIQVQARIPSDFDIGHVLTTGSGGLATLGSVCESDKSAATTGMADPIGDAFYVDYVAHELGHQLGAEHTFNGTTNACQSGRSEKYAVEPGSGSTIMAYAGICGSENLQNNSDAYFHTISISQMRDHINSKPSCGINVAIANSAPVVDAGSSWTIPANTPFTLTGNAIDIDSGQTLSYAWEEVDIGAASSSPATMVDDGFRALFRSIKPSSNPARTFPALNNLLAEHLTLGETWPTTNRDLKFRLTVRDNVGGVAADDVIVSVIKTNRAFAVTYPHVGAISENSTQQVLWNVAQTNKAPINCQSVDIAITQDQGASWQSLANKVANNGKADVIMPVSVSPDARIKVSCSDNVFFAISPLTKTAPAPDDSDNGGSGNNGGNSGGSSGGSSGGGGGSISWGLLALLGAVRIWKKQQVKPFGHGS